MHHDATDDDGRTAAAAASIGRRGVGYRSVCDYIAIYEGPWSAASRCDTPDRHSTYIAVQSSPRRDARVGGASSASSGGNAADVMVVGNRDRTRRRTSAAIRNAI